MGYGNPGLMLPCKRCFGQGCYTEAASKERRPFDYRDFKPDDRYEATCPECRGLGRVSCSLEELRSSYKVLRQRVCKERGFGTDVFDARVRRAVGIDATPMMWFQVATSIAMALGVEPDV